MYDVIHDKMVNAQITICLEKEIYLDAQGNEVLEKEAYVLAIATTVTHANYLIYAVRPLFQQNGYCPDKGRSITDYVSTIDLHYINKKLMRKATMSSTTEGPLQ